MSHDIRLVLVVGPSGAGKDSLIAGAARQLAADPRFVFPRRVVTRQADASEDHDSLGETAFSAARAAGAFALHWQAHGLSYGIPAAALRPGTMAVCNVSRTIVKQARRQFADTLTVLVTAPADLRAARVASRGREAADAARLMRAVVEDGVGAADLVIDNRGTLEAGIVQLVAYLRREIDDVRSGD